MFNIKLDNAGKKFNKEWIFRRLSFEIHQGDKLVIQGGNGSGKSTLLQVISGFVQLNEGSIGYSYNGSAIEHEKVNNYFSLASPYLQLIEDYTAEELIDHIAPAKPFIENKTASEILDCAQLLHAKGKYIRQYSSGMKQRLKLALAILADTSVLLLDEPLSNLDKNGTVWYKTMMADFSLNKTVIVCSNAINDEFEFCTRSLNLMDHKY